MLGGKRGLIKFVIYRSHINQRINVSTYQRINVSTYQLINLSTHQLINLSTHQLINLSTHQLINLSTYQLINKSTKIPFDSTRANRYINGLAVIASLGGFLFGYDTAVISGTIRFVTIQFQLSPSGTGWYVSSALLGCLIGVALSGIISDRYGRKKVLVLSALFFGLSAIGCAFTLGFVDLVIYRLIGGLGIGIASMISPLYISELSPAYKRGRLVALYQFAITIGILSSYFCNAGLLSLSLSNLFHDTSGLVHKIMVTEVWRIMLGTSFIPAFSFLLLLFLVPESPRWLVLKGEAAKASAILQRIMSQEQSLEEIEDIKSNLNAEPAGFGRILTGNFKLPLIIGITLAFLTQVSGINAIIYYGPKILEQAGIPISKALGGQVIIGIVNVLFTLIAIWKIDQLGRRPLLLAGVTGIISSLIVIGLLFYFNSTNTILLLCFILLFIGCFAFSYGPVIWVLLSEIFPMKIRGKAMSLATFSLWIGTALVGQFTPMLLEGIGPPGTFWLFALLTSPAIYIAIKILPETKGRSLEEIERYWLNKKTNPALHEVEQ
jgi:sugar porter (SP) family MFS transporter